MMVSLKAKYKYEMSDEELEKYVSKEEDKVIAKLKESLRPCVNVDAELDKLAEHKKYHLSVVSSSALRRVKASIEKVGQDKYFDGVFPSLPHHPNFTPSNSVGITLTNS
jgi:FMN phosphatase YigB (HAD superfamily)